VYYHTFLGEKQLLNKYPSWRTHNMQIPRIEKILIIDDDLSLRKYISTVLEWNEFKVYHCSDVQAVSVAKKYRPDVIILDVNMPTYNGIELFHKFSRHIDLKDIPIVFVAEVSDEKLVENFFGLGAAGFIPKPINVHRLVETLTVMWVFYHLNWNGSTAKTRSFFQKFKSGFLKMCPEKLFRHE